MAMAPRWLVFLAHSRVLAGLSVSQQLVSPSVLQLFFSPTETHLCFSDLGYKSGRVSKHSFPGSWSWWEPEPGLGY